MEKICQIIPPGTLSMFYILWTPTDRPQINIFALVPPDPGGTAIVCNSCSKKCSKWKMDATFKQKKTSATPKFCKQNFSWIHHVGDMVFL